MLTFFEYLRQRAFESVVAGAHEALDLLAHEKNLNEGPDGELESDAAGQTPKINATAPASLPADGDRRESLPAPRRRGRPKKKVTIRR